MSGTQVDSRLVVPPLPPRFLSRPRLLAALDSSADVPLVLLAAGPGAGKSVLLSNWAQRSEQPVIWITVTARDAAPQRFWRLLLTALKACGGHYEGGFPVTPQGDTTERVQALLAGLPDSPAKCVLIIDDAHLLTQPEVLDDLDGLIRSGVPLRLRLMLAARSDPLLPLHRYRLAGQMRELRAKDLSLTRGELEELLASHGVTLTGADLDVVLARTEGWVAGARLCAMRMENTEHPARLVSELALGQGSTGEYLMAEVLDRQPEPVRKLLTQTSLFDEVTGPLAEAVTGMEGCADMLAALAASNSFVIPVDAALTRFRYHQLIAEILRHELHLRERGLVPDLMRRAAAYFNSNGDVRRALYWAGRAGAWPVAASMLARGGLAHAFVHREDISGCGFDTWPSLVPQDADPAQSLESSIASSAVAAITADADTAAQLLAKLDLPVDDRLTSQDLLLTTNLAMVILGIKAGDLDTVAAAVAHVLARAHDVPEYQLPGLQAAVLLAHASTRFWHGRCVDADALLHAALAEAERTGPPVMELEVLAATALFDSLRSRPRHAEDAIHRAHTMLDRNGELNIPPALELAAATRLLMVADIPGAARALERAHVPHTVGADPALAMAREIGRAIVQLARGDVSHARDIVQRSAHTEPPLVTVLRQTLLADTETLLGRPYAALGLLRDYQDTDLAVLAAVPGARAHLALHDMRSARNCVRSVLAATSMLVNRYTLAEAMLCEAKIALLDDDTGHALDMLWAAIELAQDDIVLPFLAAQDAFTPLLARHPALGDRWPCPTGTGPVKVAVPAPRGTADLLDPLTEREQAVLRFLATSLSPGEIADEMCLSVNTVKTHLAAIYRKLGANRRREAVQRARELELL